MESSFPGKDASDPSIWCSRCTRQRKEHIWHCLWECPVSTSVWQWCEFLLTFVADRTVHAIQLLPEHLFVAESLPDQWDVPLIFWHIVRAVVAWQLWKDRCSHCIVGTPSDAQAVISKSWCRIGVYLRLEWQNYRKQIREGTVWVIEARERFAISFGPEGRWSLHVLTLQVLHVSPASSSMKARIVSVDLVAWLTDRRLVTDSLGRTLPVLTCAVPLGAC